MRFIKVSALVLGVLASAGAASAAPGDLDPSFSDDGKRTVDLGGPERGEAVALRPNPATPSSIAVAGHITPDDSGESFNFALALINSTGGSADGGCTTSAATATRAPSASRCSPATRGS